MNKKILFRAIACKNGEWVYGYYWTNELGNHFIKIVQEKNKYINDDVEVFPDTVCQYINRLDKNDNEIYEGCKCKHSINKPFKVCLEGIVEFLNDRFILRYDDQNYTDFMFIKRDDIEVIGTIFD